MFYGLFILFWMIVIAVINCIVSIPIFDFSVPYVIVAVILYVVVVIAIDGLFATLVRWCLPERWFTVDKTKLTPSKSKCRFYEKIGVKKWKDYVIELGALTKFRKNKIADPTNNEFVARYIMEANYGIIVHLSGMIFGFLLLAIYPPYWLCFGLPVALVNLLINYLSFVILRYNLPKLRTLYRINEKRAKLNEQRQAS